MVGFEAPVRTPRCRRSRTGRPWPPRSSLGRLVSGSCAAVADGAVSAAVSSASSAPAAPRPTPSPPRMCWPGSSCAASAVPVPLKLTAGLHHAVRFTDDDHRFEHHGFLNVMVAAARAMTGGDEQSVVDVLAIRSAAPLVDAIRGLDADQVVGVRGRFVSFGCCGVEDPVNDLVELGLVEERR